MKRILTFLLATAAFMQFATAQDRNMVVSVAFYNLENLFDTINNNGSRDLEYTPRGQRQWDGNKYRSKIHNMAFAISKMRTGIHGQSVMPAIIGVSEVENRSVLEDLVKDPQIRAQRYQIVHHDSPDRRGIDVGLLYNPRLFRLLNVSHHRLTIPSQPDFVTRDQTCATGILAGDTISVIVNHWPSRLGGQAQSSYLREAAAALSKHIADSIVAVHPHRGVIIMGDLNDDPSNKSCAEVIGAVKKLRDVKTGGWFNPWWEVLDKGIGTLAYKGQWNLFDQIIINSNLAKGDRSSLTYFKCRVLNDVPEMKTQEGDRKGGPLRTFASGVYLNGFSDHFPTMIFLTKKLN